LDINSLLRINSLQKKKKKRLEWLDYVKALPPLRGKHKMKPKQSRVLKNKNAANKV